MSINCISSKDSDDTRTMQKRSDKIMIGNETDKIISELFESLLQRYWKNLEEKIKGSGFVFNSVDLLSGKLHKISLNRGELYIDSPEWLKNKKTTINPKNNDDKCFNCCIK